MNKDVKQLEQAYQTILEKANTAKEIKKECDCDGNCKTCKNNSKLSSKQKKLARAAHPFDKITGADFASLKDKKESVSFDDICKNVLNEDV